MEPISKGRLWMARIMSGVAVLFLIFDGVIHALKPAPVVQAFAQLGIPIHLSVGLAILELACVALYVAPRTAILGAVLLTGYLGGATAIQLRAGAGVFPIVFPEMVGVLLWAPLYLRDDRLRALFPVRT